MLRITKESEYAFLLLGELLKDGNIGKSAAQLSESTRIAQPVTAKVLKQLVRGDILVSKRGARGGYELSRAPQDISALAVVEAIEGKPQLVQCANGVPSCVFLGSCVISPFWRFLNQEIATMLSQYSLAEMLAMGANIAVEDKL